MNQAEIAAVFSSLGISLIDQGKGRVLEDQRKLGKESGAADSMRSSYRVTVSNGTGQQNFNNAKLERRTY